MIKSIAKIIQSIFLLLSGYRTYSADSLTTQSVLPVFLVDLLWALDRIALRADEFQRPWLGFVGRLNQAYLKSFRQPRSERPYLKFILRYANSGRIAV